MMSMSERQLDAYALVLGIDVSGLATREEKVALIEERRERVADVDVLGMRVAIPVKRLHDKRLTDKLNGVAVSDEVLVAILEEIVGPDQMALIEERCTDEDGTVDTDAYALAIAEITNSDELKNF